ncbi:MAG TPA: MFS transporter [Mycobacterium sp.]|nr:MFS transporter [Mycobacterium sp.]
MPAGEVSPNALSVPGFRRVWVGATVSAAGDAASWVALVALSLRSTHASLPLLVVSYTAPVAVGGLGAGWALDRFDRRGLMILDSLVRGAAFASIPLTALFGQLGAAHLYTVAVVYGLLRMIGLAGFPSLIPVLVSEAQLDQANALEGASFGLASLAGAAFAGLAVATIGPALVVAFDAASYLVMALALWSLGDLRAKTAQPNEHHPRMPSSASFRAVVRLAFTNPVLRDTTIMFALFNVGEGALLVFLPHRALDLGLGSGGYGFLVAATTGGELLAALFLAWHTWRPPLRASITFAQLAAATAVLLLVVRSTATTVIGLVALGLCAAPMTAWAQSLRMRLVAAEAHGRLFALLRTTMQATPPVGAALAATTLSRGALTTVIAIVLVMGVPAVLLGHNLISTPLAIDHRA